MQDDKIFKKHATELLNMISDYALDLIAKKVEAETIATVINSACLTSIKHYFEKGIRKENRLQEFARMMQALECGIDFKAD